MSKQIPHTFVVIIKKKLYSLIIMVAFICLIAVPPSSTFAASNLEEGIKELAQQISRNMTETGKKKVAVVEFSDLNGNIRALGQFIAEELITELFLISPGQFEVVERRQLMKVLDEQKLTTSGLLDAKAMDSVGKILGIEAIVTGSITDLGNNVKVNARMIGVDTAKVFAVARTSIPKIGIVATMWETLIIPGSIISTIPQPTVKLSPSSVYTNKKSKIFHKYNCSGLNAEGAIEFKSSQRAIKAGGIACGRCNPSQMGQAGVIDEQEGISSAPSFQNSFLRVTLQSISKSTTDRYNRNRVNIVLIFENITNEDLLLAFQRRTGNLLGNEGVEWIPRNYSGIENISSSRNKNYYSVFNPGAKNTINLTFASNGESDETIYSFSVNMFRFVNKSQTRFSIGINDMRITQ